jgi:hypothetical protein
MEVAYQIQRMLPHNQSLEPTRLSRVRLDGYVGFGALRFTIGLTAQAAWRLSSRSLGGLDKADCT